jgi:hypothetical protein
MKPAPSLQPKIIMREHMRFAWVMVLTILFCGTVRAQSWPVKGASEIQLWSAGGHSVPGGRGNSGIWDLGVRYGWVLTDAHGPNFLKGRFEYAIDAVPAYVISQPANTAYGVGVNPLNLKWNLVSEHQVFPYLELSGGLLFTTENVPTGTGKVNFTPAAAMGVHVVRKNYAWALEGRYLHISDAGLTRLNPGINTFEVRLGFGKFRPPK